MAEKDVKDQIRNGRLMSSEVIAAAEAKMKNNLDEAQQKEYMQAAVEAEYQRQRSLLSLRKNRDEEIPIKANLEEKEKNQNELKSGTITPEELAKKNIEADSTLSKELYRIREEYYTLERQLKSNSENALGQDGNGTYRYR